MLKQVLLLAVVAVVVLAHGHGHEHDDHTHIHTHSHSHGHDDHGHSHDDHGHSHEDHTDPPVPEMDTDNKWRRVAYNWDELLQKIEKAQAEHTDCGKNCYKSVIANELAPWKDGITPAQFDAAKERVKTLYQIIDGKLYRKGECMFYLRCEGIEHFILGVLGDAKGRQSLSKDKKYPVLPDMEFVLNERDYPHSAVNDPRKPPIFSFSKSPRERDIMYPAWTFWQAGPAISVEPQGMGRWDLKYELMIKAGAKTPWRKKKNVAFFRGSRTSAERDTLVLMSREHPEIVEAAYTKNQAWKSDADTLGAPPASELKLEDHCQYKYLYNFRGVAASFRFKHLFLCGSLVFHVGDEWLEFFYPEMKPWVHYIPIREDLGDAWDLMLFARQNEDVVKSIADAGKKFIQKHLTQDDIYDYWYNLLSEYGKLITWPVALDPKASQVKHK